jgi:hypothetical protein
MSILNHRVCVVYFFVLVNNKTVWTKRTAISFSLVVVGTPQRITMILMSTNSAVINVLVTFFNFKGMSTLTTRRIIDCHSHTIGLENKILR